MATKSEKAWLAGLFEGEGSVHVTTQNGTDLLYPRIQVASTDLDVLQRALKIIGAGVIYTPKKYKPHHKVCYKLFLNKYREVVTFYHMVYPWLGRRRLKQFQDVFAKYEIGRRTVCRACGEEFWYGSNSQVCSDKCGDKLTKVRKKK